MNGIVGRSLLVIVLCLTTAGSLWGASLVLGPADAVSNQSHTGSATQLDAPLPAAVQLDLDLDRVPRSATLSADQAGQALPLQEDPLFVEWATDTAPLLGITESALIGYGVADLVMQQRVPECQLSWITVAAVDRVGGGGHTREDVDVPAALDTAERLCAGGGDTTTEQGWESAVRSIENDPAFVHRVLAAATIYATAIRSGDPISSAAHSAIDFAIAQIGLPYVWGGNGPLLGDTGFDCSGLTKAAYATGGVQLPRTAHTQFFATPRVPSGQTLLPGDLVFYGNPATKIHHVGLYIGNGQMINAPTFGMPVQVAPYRSPGDGFFGAGRPAG